VDVSYTLVLFDAARGWSFAMVNNKHCIIVGDCQFMDVVDADVDDLQSSMLSSLEKVNIILWRVVVCLCSGSSLEQIHIFALAHILRRPIIVYGIKYVKSYQGDNIGLARFQGMLELSVWML